MAAADGPGELVFYRVPGTGLGTLDEGEADAARARGFEVEQVRVATDSIDAIMQAHGVARRALHVRRCRGCGIHCPARTFAVRASDPGSCASRRSSPGRPLRAIRSGSRGILERDYRYVAFDGVNRWYVAEEHADLGEAVAIPFNAVDAGEHGWVLADEAEQRRAADRAAIRRAWQRELILNDIRGEVPKEEYEKQIAELRAALIQVEGSRTWKYSRKVARVGKARAPPRACDQSPACPPRSSAPACVGSTSSTSR